MMGAHSLENVNCDPWSWSNKVKAHHDQVMLTETRSQMSNTVYKIQSLNIDMIQARRSDIVTILNRYVQAHPCL